MIIGPPKALTIGAIALTASLREVHGQTATVTDAPIERGSNISDHRRVNAPTLSIDAIISDAGTTSEAEIDDDGNVTRRPVTEAGTTSTDAYVKLLALFEAEDLFDVITSARVYARMHFTKFDRTIDRNTDTVVAFSADMRQIDQVSSSAVVVSAADKPKASSKVDKGAQSKSAADDGPSRGVLDEIGHTISGGADPASTLLNYLNRSLGP